ARDVLAFLRRDLVSVGQRVVREAALEELRRALPHPAQCLRLRDEDDLLDERVDLRVEPRADRVDLLGRRVELEEDLDEQLLLDVVAVGEHPGAEPDRRAEHEQGDEDRHRRGDRRRGARGQRAPGLAEHHPHAGHSVVYPPRRSSRARRPSSSAITRLRILSTISRSCVTMRTVVPARLIRYRSCMIPTEVSGSRFPVGSSQTSRGGWLTNALAIDTRCCSPPESSSGRAFMRCESPTIASTSGTFLRIELRPSPCTLSA